MTIYENVVYSLRINGVKDKEVLDEVVETSLKEHPLGWSKKIVYMTQRLACQAVNATTCLCGSRFSNESENHSLDEPTSALDPISAGKIEETLHKLKDQYTMLLVTRSMQQASRISDKTVFFLNEDLIEFNATKEMFSVRFIRKRKIISQASLEL